MNESVDYTFFRQLVREKAGIVLEERQNYLIEARLEPLARAEGFESLEKMRQHLIVSSMNGLHQKVVEAMTTNETYFFRDIIPFDVLKASILPQLIEKRAAVKELNIWTAACSTGQEPYSIAMILKDKFPLLESWKVRIDASDFSADVLKKAKEGSYTQLEVNRGLPAVMLVKYFEKWGIEWKLKDPVKNAVNFFEINLTGNWPPLPVYDIVFLRNVMIYFDVEMKKKILAGVKKHLKPDGYLFLGGAETTMNLDKDFDRCAYDRAGCYALKAA